MGKMAIHSELHARFCRNIRARRAELGLTQQAVADALGVSQPQVAMIESGAATPTLDTVERMANALRIAPEELLLAAPVAA